jgi:hypothetical protein
MEDKTKKLLNRVGLALGTIGTLGLVYVLNKNRRAAPEEKSRWARPGMWVTFRAELMPGRDREARSYRVSEVLPNDRVRLEAFVGEHTRDEFEPLRFE